MQRKTKHSIRKSPNKDSELYMDKKQSYESMLLIKKSSGNNPLPNSLLGDSKGLPIGEKKKFTKTTSVIRKRLSSQPQKIRQIKSDSVLYIIKKNNLVLFEALKRASGYKFYEYILRYSTNDFKIIENILHTFICYDMFKDILKYCLIKEVGKELKYMFRDQSMETQCVRYFINWEFLLTDYCMKDMVKKISRLTSKKKPSDVNQDKIFKYINKYLKNLPNYVHYVLNMCKNISNESKEKDNASLIILLYLRIIIPTIIRVSGNRKKIVNVMKISLVTVNEICEGKIQHPSIKKLIVGGMNMIKNIDVTENLYDHIVKDPYKVGKTNEFLLANIDEFKWIGDDF